MNPACRRWLRWAMVLAVLVPAVDSQAQLTDLQRGRLLAEAQEAYDQGVSLLPTDPEAANHSFRTAVRRFQQLVDNGLVNGRLHYNLANAYLQSGELGLAILHYRNAQQFIPGDAKLRHNLEYVRSLRRNQIAPSGQRALAGAFFG